MKFINNLHNKLADNIYLLSILSFLISIFAYKGFEKLIPFIVCTVIYFSKNKKITSFKSTLKYALVFAFLRLLFLFTYSIFNNFAGMVFGFYNFIYKLSIFVLLDFIISFLCFYLLNAALVVLCKIKNKEKITFSIPKINYEKLKKKITILISIIIIFSVFALIKELPKYRFGYFVKGPEMRYNHYGANVLKLDNGNILILGYNKKTNLPSEPLEFKEIPSEIYDYKENKFYDLKLPNTIKYLPKGITLPGNKLLLTYVCNSTDNPNKIKYKPRYSYTDKYDFYSHMAVIDLNTNKIEKMIDKKINTLYEPNENHTKFIYLNDGNILIFDYHNKIAEVYDTKTNNSILIEHIDMRHSWDYIYAFKENYDVLIFGARCANTPKNNCVLKYHYKTKTIAEIPIESLARDPLVKKIGDNKIAIIEKSKIEILNAATLEAESGNNLIRRRGGGVCNYKTCYNGIDISQNLILITGGKTSDYPICRKLKTAEIYNINQENSYKIMNMPFALEEHEMVKLNNGDILILEMKNLHNHRTLIFKNRKRGQK